MGAFDELDALPLQRIWERIAARSLHGERLTLSVVELDPGAVVAEHSHDNEQLGVVLSGSLVFRIGDEARELAAGALYRIPSNTPHEVEIGPEGAVVIDVFSPVRSEWQALEREGVRPPRWPA